MKHYGSVIAELMGGLYRLVVALFVTGLVLGGAVVGGIVWLVMR